MDYNSRDALYYSNYVITHIVTIKFNGKRKWQFEATCFHDEGEDENAPVTFYKVKNDIKDYCTYVEWTNDEYITICINNEFIFADLIKSTLASDNMNIKFDCENEGDKIFVECKYLLDNTQIDAEIEAKTNELMQDSLVDAGASTQDGEDIYSQSSFDGTDIFLLILASPIVGVMVYFLTALLVGDDSEYFTLWFIILFIIGMLVLAAEYYAHKNGDITSIDTGKYRRGRTRLPKTRIRKYDPTDWRKPNKRGKQFY